MGHSHYLPRGVWSIQGKSSLHDEAEAGGSWGADPRAPLTPLHSHLWPSILQPDLPLRSLCHQFRNPKASLRVRLCDLLGHLQRSNERDCQEFYRALYIHAQPLHSRLPSRHTLRKCVSQSPGLSICVLSASPEDHLWPSLVSCGL